MNFARNAFCLRLPFGLGLYGGLDRYKHCFVALAQRHDIPGFDTFLVGGREVRMTIGGWYCWTISREGMALGRLWVEWV